MVYLYWWGRPDGLCISIKQIKHCQAQGKAITLSIDSATGQVDFCGDHMEHVSWYEYNKNPNKSLVNFSLQAEVCCGSSEKKETLSKIFQDGPIRPF